VNIVPQEHIDEYTAKGWWGTETLSDRVRANASARGDVTAFVNESVRLDWKTFDDLADRIAAHLMREGLSAGQRIGVLLEDGPLVHATYVGAERAGVVVVGLGGRAGDRELQYLLTRTDAVSLVSRAQHRGDDMEARAQRLAVPGLTWLGIDEDLPPASEADRIEMQARRIGPNELFLLNSTSGTTGMPKLVTQFQNRWFFYLQLAQRAANLTPDDVFMSVVPAPFGFGLWTAHFIPTLLGAPTVVMSKFDATEALRMIERERVTVLAAVSTQFLLMLNSPEMGNLDLSSLRAMFTGGEAVPYEKAAAFEERTGAAVLQFFGSNETGGFSGTTLADTRERRLTSAGRVLPEMNVRLFDDDGNDVTATGGPAQPGGHGPAMCAGYFDDDAANAELYTADGDMLMGDYVTIDEEGYLTVVGRKSDFIIRGGKNISAPAVEAEVAQHPSIDLAAAIAAPDEVFGERVLVVVTLVPGASATLADINAMLAERGVTREMFPEYLAIVDEMPIASGGKIAKSALKDQVADLVARAETTINAASPVR